MTRLASRLFGPTQIAHPACAMHHISGTSPTHPVVIDNAWRYPSHNMRNTRLTKWRARAGWRARRAAAHAALARHARHDVDQLAREVIEPGVADPALGALDRAVEALVVERLEHVVERLDVERGERVGVVRGDEHDREPAVVADRGEDIEAA